MAKIFYQALRNLRPFTEKKDSLLTPDYVRLTTAKDKYHIARIKIDFLGDTLSTRCSYSSGVSTRT